MPLSVVYRCRLQRADRRTSSAVSGSRRRLGMPVSVERTPDTGSRASDVSVNAVGVTSAHTDKALPDNATGGNGTSCVNGDCVRLL